MTLLLLVIVTLDKMRVKLILILISNFAYRTHEVVFNGELLKWIVISPKRIHQIAFTMDDIEVTLVGALRELVFFTVTLDGLRIQHLCDLGDTGSAVLSIMTGSCEHVML